MPEFWEISQRQIEWLQQYQRVGTTSFLFNSLQKLRVNNSYNISSHKN